MVSVEYPFLGVEIWSIYSLKRRLQVKNASRESCLSKHLLGGTRWCFGKAYKVIKFDPVQGSNESELFCRRYFDSCHGNLAKLQTQLSIQVLNNYVFLSQVQERNHLQEETCCQRN